MSLKFSLLLVVVALLLCGCKEGDRTASNNAAPTTNQSNTETNKVQKMEIKVSSAAFQAEGLIPKQYTCDGANISPPLSWEAVPGRAKTIALIADDPDAPAKTWVHWVVFNLPASARELTENLPAQENIASGGRQGTNDFRKVGYGGPCPPNGTHRYFFKLYALDTELNLDSKTTKDQLLKAMEGHVIAEGELMGKYKRE